MVTVSGSTETSITTTTSVTYSGSNSWTDTAVGQTKRWTIYGTQTRGTDLPTYTIRLKNGTSNNISVWTLQASESNSMSSQTTWKIDMVTTRTSDGLNLLGVFTSPDSNEAKASEPDYFRFIQPTITSNNVPALNTLGTYNITLQSNKTPSTLRCYYIEILSIV